jgi:two-component system phosphate regulon response regulator OmpR
MLPGEDGLSACRRLRAANNQVPIIMLTAKGDELSRIKGLELGADDYLAKPFNPDELMARVKAVLRRQSAPVPGAPASEDETVTFGEYELSLATRELKKGDQVHMLTTGEFAVLKALVMHAREPLTRDKLMNLARGREWDALERSIDVQISRLRRLIEVDAAKPRYIQTVWGVGYVFVPDGANKQ